MELLNDMALFVEVARAMSFRRAADAIGVPNSTLSRRVSALEKAIGLRLLHRTTRKLELTEAGLIYFERCKRIVDEARLAHEQTPSRSCSCAPALGRRAEPTGEVSSNAVKR